MNKNKVSDMAKDFGLTSKDILSVLSTYEDGSKKPSQVLSADEVNLIFEHLTQKHQVKIESIYAESAPQKKPEPKAAPAQNQPKANNAQNQPRNNNNNGGSRPQPQQGQQGKPAQPQQNAQPVQQQSKSTATQHPTTRVPEKKIVDTRKVTLLRDFQSKVISTSDHGSNFMFRCHIYRMDCRRRNFYKCLCLLRSFQVSLTDFSEPPVITRFCNVMQLTPFIDLHSLWTVLTVSDQISPFTQTGLLCN